MNTEKQIVTVTVCRSNPKKGREPRVFIAAGDVSKNNPPWTVLHEYKAILDPATGDLTWLHP